MLKMNFEQGHPTVIPTSSWWITPKEFLDEKWAFLDIMLLESSALLSITSSVGLWPLKWGDSSFNSFIPLYSGEKKKNKFNQQCKKYHNN